VGKRHVETAMAKLGSEFDIKLEWMPYFLNANTPEEGEDLMEYLRAKYGEEATARFSGPNNPLDNAGAKLNPPVVFNKVRKVIPTVRPHRVVEWVTETHNVVKADTFMEILFRRYCIRSRPHLSAHLTLPYYQF
jgi:predicted DsbA family dithiol-disulfide isomerase